MGLRGGPLRGPNVWDLWSQSIFFSGLGPQVPNFGTAPQGHQGPSLPNPSDT